MDLSEVCKKAAFANLVDLRLSETRDMAAAKAFFQQTQDIANVPQNTFSSESMRCKRYLKPLRGEKKGERYLAGTDLRFEESVLTISNS